MLRETRMIANINRNTGIPFGYISANQLDSEVVDQLMFGPQARNLSWERCLEEFLREQRAAFDCCSEEQLESNPYNDDGEFDEALAEERAGDLYMGDEEIIEGELDGVKYATSWLGGALNFYIFESPVIAKCRPCSPCVQNAGDLGSEGDYEAYGVPEDWLYKEVA